MPSLSTDKSLQVEAIVADVYCAMDIIVSCILDYTVCQATGSVLCCFLYISREAMAVRDILVLLILNQCPQLFFCFVHMSD